MDRSLVSDFLSEKPKDVAQLAVNIDPESLVQAEQVYNAYKGRLPSLVPLEPLKPSKKLESVAQEFALDMNRFLSQLNDRDAEKAFRDSSWSMLECEADKAWCAYDRHGKSRRTWRRPFGIIDKKVEQVMSSSYIECLLELLPDGDYSSLLSGGLTLVYNAALKKKEVREDIFQLFDSLSDRTKDAKSIIKLYSHDTDLNAKSEELYMAVLDCVRLSTKWLDSNSAFETFKAFFQQSTYGAKLSDAKANIDKKSQEFKNAIDMCLRRQVDETHRNIELLKNPVLHMYSFLAGFVKDWPVMLDSLKLQAQSRQPPVVNNFIHQETVTMQTPQQPQVLVSCLQLLEWLAVEYNSMNGNPQEAIQNALNDLHGNTSTAMHHNLSLLEREKLGVLTLDSRFATWLRGQESALLVAFDDVQAHHQGLLSALSHLSGLMGSNMRAPGMWTATFFCGLHTASGTKLQGARGLMRAILLQLLSTIPDATFSPAFDPNMVAYKLLHGDLGMMCAIFGIVLSQLPVGMVFILIDGAHWNGTQSRSAEMRTAVQFLNEIVAKLRSAQRGLVLKVLVTNPTDAQRFAWGFSQEDVHMERFILAGGHHGTHERVISGTATDLGRQ